MNGIMVSVGGLIYVEATVIIAVISTCFDHVTEWTVTPLLSLTLTAVTHRMTSSLIFHLP